MTPPPSKLARYEADDTDLDAFEKELASKFRECCLVQELKYQEPYLAPTDADVIFDECKHIYMLKEKDKRFGISVTGFCKNEIQHSEFDTVRIIRNYLPDNNDQEYDMHALRLIEWKFASVFGSMFHAIIEYFFNNVVNKCQHEECKLSPTDKRIYDSYLLNETHNQNLDNGILSQAPVHNLGYRSNPPIPCNYALNYYNIFVRVVTDANNLKAFLQNNPRYNIHSEFYVKEIENTLENAFDCNKDSLKYGVVKYRKTVSDIYHTSIYSILDHEYRLADVQAKLDGHLTQFKRILRHLPLDQCFDIRPEYIVHNKERGLAGSVDLTMRLRSNPHHLLVYDWKTCKKIYTTFQRNGQAVNQLLDYSCQLHTYHNLMKDIDQRFRIEMFVVNITPSDGCIYFVNSAYCCECYKIYHDYKQELINV